MCGKCQSRLHTCKEVWYWTMVISLVLVLRRSGILWKRTAHKEFGIISRKRCWWNSQRVDVQFSVQRLHCPGVNSKAKDTENCRFTLLPTKKQLRLFFAQMFLQISSVSAELSQTCVKNVNPFTIDQGNLMWWWDNQLSSVKSRQKFFWRMTTRHIRIFYCSDMKNESKVFHTPTEWVNFVWMQDSYMLLRLDSISWLKTLENNFMQWPVVKTLFQEKMDHHNQKDGYSETQKIGPVLEVTTSYLYGKHGIEIRIWSLSQDNSQSWVRTSHGFNKLVTNLNNSEQETTEVQFGEHVLKLNCEWFCIPNKDKSKTTKTQFCQLIHKSIFFLVKELGPMLNQENIQSPIMQCRRN